MPISRRLLLAVAAGLTASRSVARGQPAKRLTAGTRILEVNGKAAKVFGLTGPGGAPGITLDPGERFAVTLDNRAGTKTIIHWHGQRPGWLEDGFPWPQTPPIAAGASETYDFAAAVGTHWMHSHQDMQEQGLMAAPLIVHDRASAGTQNAVMFLHDFSFKSPTELLAGLSGNDAAVAGMQPVTGMAMAGMAAVSQPDLNDIQFDAFLANDRTLADPAVIWAAAGDPVRLRIINASTSTNFWICLGRLRGELVGVDGHEVVPVAGTRFPIAMAQRLDIMVRLPAAGTFPIFAQVEGARRRTGIILATPGAGIARQQDEADQPAPPVDLSLEARLSAVAPLPQRPIDTKIPIHLGGDMSRYRWSMNGKTWPAADILTVKPGERVVFDMVNDSMMSHPMHLHGHVFQVLALNGLPVKGAVRDTVLVPPKGAVRIGFDANNPGRWAFHCHNLYHMMAGMMMEVRYPGIV